MFFLVFCLQGSSITLSTPKNVILGITGGTGDIGSSFIKMLNKKDLFVKALIQPASVKKQSLILKENKHLHFIIGEIFNKKALNKLSKQTGVIFHFVGLVGQDLENEKALAFATNAVGTAILADIANSHTSKKFIYASSQRVYGIEQREEIKKFVQIAVPEIKKFVRDARNLSVEETKTKSIQLAHKLIQKLPSQTNIYDISKLIGEKFMLELPNSIVVRISNAYGPDYYHNRLINRIIIAAISGKTTIEKNEYRDFIYQDDLNQILLSLSEAKSFPKIIDVASGDKKSIQDIKGTINEFYDKKNNSILAKGVLKDTAKQNNLWSKKLLGRDFISFRKGMQNTVTSLNHAIKYSPSHEIVNNTIVLDVGGTSLRAAIYRRDGKIIHKEKINSPSFMRIRGDIKQLQTVFLIKIASLVNELRGKHPKMTLSNLAIAFPGPVNNKGIITGAATLWGKKGEKIKFDIAKELKQIVPGLENVYVLNDNSSAIYRYIKRTNYKNIAVMTVSSGISYKIYLKGRNGLLMDDKGLTGEIGHLRLKFNQDAEICDCGGKGHLGALSSGRGAERIAWKLAYENHRDQYKKSLLFNLSLGRPKSINNEMLIKSIHEHDSFALSILDQTTEYLADIIAYTAVSFSIEKFIIVGGFAQAVGKQYIESLNKRLRKHDFYGQECNYYKSLVELGINDDLDNLIGIGNYAQEQQDIQY